MSTPRTTCSRTSMLGYSIGECTNSLVMNSLFGFAMLYYTDALGLPHASAGIAMAVAVFWDAVTDPVMGHISDNTRSRFGRRHPYMLWGGLATLATYIFLWYVPSVFTTSIDLLFWYLVGINLLQRTAITAFYVPFTALGFEICTDYSGRVTLQGIRSAVNMLANILGPGLAWAIFFANNDTVRATSVPGNYLAMGTGFAAVSLLCLLIVLVVTRRYIHDTRSMPVEGNSITGFVKDMREILADRLPRYVFGFTLVIWTGVALVSSLQMYLYEHFMRFGGFEKTFVHSGSMVGFAIGSLVASRLTVRFDKKGGVIWGGLQSVLANVVLGILFLPGLVVPEQTMTLFSLDIPLAFLTFGIFHMLYWMGNGMIFPIVMSMMADVSEINEIRTGINKDGAYAAVFSFSQKVAISVAVLLSGYVLLYIGFEPGREVVQSADTLYRLCIATLVAGPAISLVSLVLIRLYPVTGQMLADLRAARTEIRQPT